jgi:rhodanese-related sulfurtransferase
MGRFAVAVVVGVFVAASASTEEPAHPEAPSITPAELHAQRESGTAPLVIDVRTPEEYASGHIPGAVNIPFDEVAQRIEELQAPNGVALYCMVGPRARKGESDLLEAGHTAVFHLDGGLAAWQQAGFTVEEAQ